MWILRNLTEDHGGKKGQKIVSEREANHKETLKYREQTGLMGVEWWEGKVGDGH